MSLASDMGSANVRLAVTGHGPVRAPDRCPKPRGRLSVSGTCLPTVCGTTTSVSQMTSGFRGKDDDRQVVR
jgi:hypothetical protein